MSDPVDPPEAHPAAEGVDDEDPGQPDDGPFPWDADPADDPAAEDPDAPRQRHDAFTEARKAVFLRALVKTGCIQDACRHTGLAPRTVYRHQQGDPRFFDHCHTAIRMSATPLELTAWQRAVEGVEQEFACGGQVHVRRRYDGSMLRLLLQGSDPKKYGPRPGFKRKRLLKAKRKQIEREIRAEIAAKAPSFEQSIGALERGLAALDIREEPKRLAAGWTKGPDGYWTPPGFGPIPGWVPPPAPGDGEEPPGESM